METLVKVLKEKNKTISSCESLTGGLFASSIGETFEVLRIVKEV